jgi:hypothetical protein
MREDFALEYDKLFGQTCRRIFGEGVLYCDDGTKTFEVITIELDTHRLEFRVCPDTDEVIYAISENTIVPNRGQAVDFFDEFNGLELG